MNATNSVVDSLVVGHTAPAYTHGCPRTAHKCQLVLENLYDSYNAYKTCAEDCKDIELQTLFQKVAMNRSHFINQLSSVLRSEYGFEPWVSFLSLSMFSIGQLHSEWHPARLSKLCMIPGPTSRLGSMVVSTKQRSLPKFTAARHTWLVTTLRLSQNPNISRIKSGEFFKSNLKASKNKMRLSTLSNLLIFTNKYLFSRPCK